MLLRDAVMNATQGFSTEEITLTCKCCEFLLQNIDNCSVGINTFGSANASGTTGTTGQQHHNHNKNSGRIVLTKDGIQYQQWISSNKSNSNQLYFVSFIGFLRKGNDDVGEERWETDEHMCHELLTMKPSILSYTSIKVDDGDYFNLVIFKKKEFLNSFETSLFHLHAIKVLSPLSFSDICVRSGRLMTSVLKLSTEGTISKAPTCSINTTNSTPDLLIVDKSVLIHYTQTHQVQRKAFYRIASSL